MKSSGLYLFFLLIPCWAVGYSNDPAALEESVIRKRLESLPCLIEPKYVSAVKGYLKTYLIDKRDKAQQILGRALIYFPLFEEELRKAGLPEELKYLAVVESALIPTAISRSGAGGLWQFMPQTGASYGLLINAWVDERFDPVKATRAAVQHLQKQYKRFGSWELALAAYNSGAGRVHRAIKRAHSRNFWRVRRYLPRETRNYVPAFIAATYLFHYYYLYQLVPQLPPLDLQLTTTHLLTEPLTIEEISNVTGLDPQIIQALNPAWRKGVIAAHQRQAWLRLPIHFMPAIKDYLELRRQYGYAFDPNSLPQPETIGPNWKKVHYVVKKGETLKKIAQKFQCHPLHLQMWNHIATLTPPEGAELVVWQPARIHRYKPGHYVQSLPIPTPQVIKTFSPQIHPQQQIPAHYQWHRIQRMETLLEIAHRYGVSLEQLYEWNPILKSTFPLVGTRIKVGIKKNHKRSLSEAKK